MQNLRPLLTPPKQKRPLSEYLFLGLIVILVVAAVAIGSAWLVDSGEKAQKARPGKEAAPTTGKPPAPAATAPYASFEDDGTLERILDARLSVNPSRDSGTTCEQRNKRGTQYVCSTLKGNEDMATGFIVRCNQPVTSSTAVGCAYTRMSAKQRCLFGVRSGIPATGGVWDEEAVICRQLGVPID